MSRSRSPVLVASLIAAALFAGACGGDDLPPPPTGGRRQTQEAGKTGTAVVKGKVVLAGAAPARRKLDLAGDPTCSAGHAEKPLAEEFVPGSDGTIQNVLVYVRNVTGAYPAPSEPVVLDQVGCLYEPHVTALQVGQPITIKNSDATLHNVHAFPKAQPGFNEGMPTKGMTIAKTFEKPEIGIAVKCDVHSWMLSYFHVLSHPFYAVTREAGTFEIRNLPAGTWEIVAWHETLGEKTTTVTVADGATEEIEIALGS